MEQGSTTRDADGTGLFAGDAWFDPIEVGIREQIRWFIQELLEQELMAALGRDRCERASGEPRGYRNVISVPAWCMDRLVGAEKLGRVKARLLF